MEAKLVCKTCQNPVSETYYFCPYCGRKLRTAPLLTSLSKQIGVYLFAFFFPPFGIIPAFRYLNQPDNKSKIIGLITLLLTGFSLMLAVYSGYIFYQFYVQTLAGQGIEVGLGI